MTCSALRLCLASCFTAIVVDCQITTTFDDFIQIHGRQYARDSDEYNMRRGIFDSNVASIEKHNRAKTSLWTREVNKFADWTKQELSSLQGERPYRPQSAKVLALTSLQHMGTSFPEHVDWSNLTSLKDIQDQGGCGSCWAVSAMTTLRAHAEIWRGDSRKLSVQQLVSCMENPDQCGGTGGCDGATAGLALKYVLDNGIAYEDDFPYTAEEKPCPARFKRRSPSASFLVRGYGNGGDSTGGMSDFTVLPENKMAPVMQALYEYGPVKVSIAVPDDFISYASGILDTCPKNAILTHGAVMIGYGEDKKLKSKYWRLQNSWGENWGDGGRFKLLRRDIGYEESEACGWDTEPEKGNGCIDGPAKIRVCGMCGLLSNVIVPKMIASGGMSQMMNARRLGQ
mmetsp:Transcript_160182/g.292518  ORF Transcript_160182/g.292518 Transcript_160182/m.292518 type:complete len:398 (-) Transcript_160182:49-1242(-)